MRRVTEPELMNDPVQARAYARADFSEPHDAFVEKFATTCQQDDIDDVILDLGCGPADIAIRMARKYPNCHIHGIDGSESMLSEGERRIATEHLQGRIDLRQALIPDQGPPLDKYRVIISNSLLHHLHRPDVLWAYIQLHAMPAARVFIMDLSRPASVTATKKLVNTYSGDEPEILRQDFFNSLRAAFTPQEVRQQLDQNGLNGLQVEILSDRHLVIYGQIT